MSLDVDNKNPWNVLLQLAGKVNGTDKVSHDDLQKLLKEADANGDGLIELQEFKDAFLTSEEYKALEEEYLEAFEEIAELDGEEESISEADIEEAIAEYDKLVEEATATPPSTDSGGSYSGNNGGNKNNGGETTVADLSSKDLPELKSERADVLKDIANLRSEKSEAIAEADENVMSAQEEYDKATKAFADLVKDKMDAEDTTNEFARDVVVFEDQKNALQSDISDQKATISQSTDLVSTLNSELSSLVAPPETISYLDEASGETVTEHNPAYDDYLAKKEALEDELAAAEADLAEQEEKLAVLESDLTNTEILLEGAILAYGQAEEAAGTLTEAEEEAYAEIIKQSELYNEAKIAKEEVSAKYDEEMDALQASLVAYNDAIMEKELELPDGYEVNDSKITNGENNLAQIAEDELPDGYEIDGTSIKDEEGNVVGMVTGTEENPQLYMIEEIEPASIGPALCYYNARAFFDEAISSGVDPAESKWADGGFADLSSEDIKQMQEYYDDLVAEYNANLDEGQTPVLTFTEEAKSRYADNEETKADYEAIVDSIEKVDSKAKVRPDSFEAYLNKNNVDISSATDEQLREYLDKFIDEKYGELYNEDYYPPVTDEQLVEYLGEDGLEALKEADEASVTSKINKILTDDTLTPYQQMQLLQTIKSYSDDTKSYVDNYFKNDDTYFYQMLDEMTQSQKADGTFEYSSEDLVEFIKQYKNLDSSSSVLGADSKIASDDAYMQAILSVYDRTEDKEQLSELSSYLNAGVIADYVQQNYAGEEAQTYIQKLFEATVTESLTDDGKLSVNPEDYGLTDEDELATLESTYLKSGGSSSDKVDKIMEDLNAGTINRSAAQYLVSSVLGGDPQNITSIQSTKNSSVISEVFKLFDSKPYEAFLGDTKMVSEYINDQGTMPYLLIGPENVDPNEELPVIVYMPGSGESFSGEAGLKAHNTPDTIFASWGLEGFNGYIICPTLTGEYNAGNWANKTSEEYLRELLADFETSHNVATDQIYVGGHSLGANGALYMAEHMDDVFSKAFILSGYRNDSLYKIDSISEKMDIIGFNGTGDSGYMASDFRKTVGDDNYFDVAAGHGKVPVDAFTMDRDGNGRSDLLEWLLEGKQISK